MSKVYDLVEVTEDKYLQNVIELIDKYVDKHGDVALICGGEWMYQDNEGQVDALELVSDILDVLKDFADDEDD